MRLDNLADVCRAAGLTVQEVPGWKARGRPFAATPQSIICHHTAGAQNRKDYPSLAVVRDGRRDLPGPLAQLGLGRSGTVYVIASGRANHAGRTSHPRYRNGASIGIEAENSGREPWPPEQMTAYAVLVAALIRAYGIPLAHVQGHKEVAVPRGRKPDPSFPMDVFRGTVAAFLDNGIPRPQSPQSPTPQGDHDMLRLGDKDPAGTFEIKTLQRNINGVNARSARLGAEQVEEIAVDGHFGPGTAKALAHALPRAMAACGVDWHKDWTDQVIGPAGLALLQNAVIRLGDQLAKAGEK